MNLLETKRICQKYQIVASKKMGQNFLIDQNIVQKILTASPLAQHDVIEIGPGLGTLTLPLVQKAKSVVAYEIDRRMIAVLQARIPRQNFTLLHQDFLMADLAWKSKRVIIGNVPYNITSKIIFKILANETYLHTAIIMVQKEVADRILAHVHTKHYGKLTVAIQTVAKIEKVVDVKSSAFFPSPKVDSTVIKFTFDRPYNQELFEFIKHCFAFRRKTLFNNLKSFLSIEDINVVLQKTAISKQVRPQNLSTSEYIALFRAAQQLN